MKRAIIDLDTVSADVLARRIEMLSSRVDNRTEKRRAGAYTPANQYNAKLLPWS